jgi:hypothetical protein
LALRSLKSTTAASGTTTMGITMVKIPKPHRQPGPCKVDCATGPPIHVVIMYGDVANDSIRARFLRVLVSAMKTVMMYETAWDLDWHQRGSL